MVAPPKSIAFLFKSSFLLLLTWPLFIYAQGLQEADYHVGPGDILEISVWDHDDLSRTVQVSEEGSISFPFIGRINVSKLTCFKIEKSLERSLADGYLVAPQVSVKISEYRNQKVFLFGEVKKPGVYQLTHRYNLLELISEAGGFTDERGSICTIVRPASESKKDQPSSIAEAKANELIQIDIDNLIKGTMKTLPPVVDPGDTIYVAEAEKIYVTGEVKSPGVVTWKKGLTVREAISQAGGETPRGALRRTTLVRKVDGVEKEMKPSLSDALLPGDILNVPESYF